MAPLAEMHASVGTYVGYAEPDLARPYIQRALNFEPLAGARATRVGATSLARRMRFRLGKFAHDDGDDESALAYGWLPGTWSVRVASEPADHDTWFCAACVLAWA